jgi:hypothetical protein
VSLLSWFWLFFAVVISASNWYDFSMKSIVWFFQIAVWSAFARVLLGDKASA